MHHDDRDCLLRVILGELEKRQTAEFDSLRLYIDAVIDAAVTKIVAALTPKIIGIGETHDTPVPRPDVPPPSP